MTRVQQVLESSEREHDRYLKEFKEYLSIPSISTLPEHKQDMQLCAEWLANHLKSIGFRNVEILATAGHSVVYGEYLNAPGKPTVAVYGHYDVQPVDPLNEWTSPPFEPSVREESMYARGASDSKGQGHAVLKALEAWLKSDGLPVNVKIFFEGEEEVGSVNFDPFLVKYKSKLACDFVLNCDSQILKPDLPTLVYGLRGAAVFEVWAYGAKSDLHSGLFGGSVPNPAHVLCELVAGMHDADGRVTLPGFYDKVRVRSEEERAELARIPISDEAWREMSGTKMLYGEKGFTTAELIGTRPTLEVNGIISGFTGEGVKMIVPAKAMVKISMRLVPEQDDRAVESQLKEYLRKNAPPTVNWEVKSWLSTPAVLVDRNTPAMRAAASALQATFGIRPIFQLIGGSNAAVNMVKARLGLDSVLLGFGMPEDNIHAPNERQHLPTYYRGIETYIRFLDLLSQE